MIRSSRILRRAADRTVVLLRGDGIGPEIVDGAVDIIEASGVQLTFDDSFTFTGDPPLLDENLLDAIEQHRIVFKGPITVSGSHPIQVRDQTYTSANQALRKHFQLFANVRPAKSLPVQLCPAFPNVDLIVVRENTEDLYTGEERWIDKDTVETVKRISRGASTRIATFAFDLAVQFNRSRITAVHKANVCQQSDGLFLECARTTAKQYYDVKNISFDTQLADSLLTDLVLRPQTYDVLLCPNMYGDLVSDLAAGLIGSLGLMPSGQYGDHHAVFEPAHGSAPHLAGTGQANPTSQIRTAILMLQHLGYDLAANKIESALDQVYDDAAKRVSNNAPVSFLTPDLGGTGSTRDFVEAVISWIE